MATAWFIRVLRRPGFSWAVAICMMIGSFSLPTPAEAARAKARPAAKDKAAAKKTVKPAGRASAARAVSNAQRTAPGTKRAAAALAASMAATSASTSAGGQSADDTSTSSNGTRFDAADQAFFEARRLFVNGQPVSSERTLSNMPGHPLADYPAYWQLSSALRGSGTLSVEPAVEKFLANSANQYLVDQLREDWIVALVRRERWADALAQGALLRARDDRAVQCHLWTAELKRGASLNNEARELLLSPRELGDGCNTLLQSADARGQLSRDDMLWRLRLSAESGAHATGRRAAAMLAMDSPDLMMAMRAPGYLLSKGSRDSEALVMAIATMARNEPEEAAERLSSLRLSTDASEFAWAVVAAQGAQKLSPQSIEWTRRGANARVSDDTRSWMIRSALAAGDWSLVQRLIQNMSAAGRQDPTWVYWLARAFREQNRLPESQALLRSIAGQWSFYGHLAADDLGMAVHAPPVPAPISEREAQQARTNPGIQRALKLYSLGLRMDGNREWNFALRDMTDRQLIATADFACSQQILDRCVNTADRTRNEHNLGLRFLAPFRDRLQIFAKEHGLDPAWVYGLIRQESRFLMEARSHVGAQGLMQIMPKTASWIARQLGHAGFTVRDLNDLDTNLRFGTFYLRDVSNRLEQSEVMASAAYNAGPGRPARWRQAVPVATDGALFAEIIPFNETRDYVKKVLWNATWYATVFSGQPQSLKARLGLISPRAAKIARLDGQSSPADRDSTRTPTSDLEDADFQGSPVPTQTVQLRESAEPVELIEE